MADVEDQEPVTEPTDASKNVFSPPDYNTPKEGREPASDSASSSSSGMVGFLPLIILGFVLLLSLVAIVALAIALAVEVNKDKENKATGRKAGYWYKINPDGPQPHERLAHSACTVNEEDLYIHGGFFGSGNHTLADLWKYHEPTDRWEQIIGTGDVPPGRLHHSMVSVNDEKILVFGGFNYFNTVSTHQAFEDLYSLDIRTKVWTRLDTSVVGPKPTARGAHDAVYMNGYMYVFGGFPTIAATGHSEELWRYDPRTNTWANLTTSGPMPEGRIGFAFTTIGSKAYLFGGGCESQGQCGDTWEYDTLTNTWTDHRPTAQNANDVPTPRRATHGEIAIHGILYLFGGVHISVVGGAPSVQMLDDLHAYDPSANKWFEIHPDFDRGERPPPTFGHSVNHLGERLVVFGGRTNAPSSPGSNQLWEYDTIPPRN